jgi:hypothetical protein
VAGVPISVLPLAPQTLDVLRRFSFGRPRIVKADSQTADSSIRSICISDLITGRIFSVALLFARVGSSAQNFATRILLFVLQRLLVEQKPPISNWIKMLISHLSFVVILLVLLVIA